MSAFTQRRSPRFRKKNTSNDSLKQVKSPGINSVSSSFQADSLVENTSSVMVVDKEQNNMELVKEFLPNHPFSMDNELMAENIKAIPRQQNNDILNFEDDDIAAECEAYQDHGPFNDFELLRQRPAHLAVFFNYVIAIKEPSEFLLTLAVDNYKILTNTKEMLKSGDYLFKTYLGANAPYKVGVDFGILQNIQQVLNLKSPPEEGLRGVFDPAVQVANKKIRTQLSEYRMKREQGLGSLFGDEKLQHAINLDQQSDIRIVDEIITPTLSEWLQKGNPSDDLECARQSIVVDALQTFLNQYGKRVKKSTNRIYSMLRSKQTLPSSKSNKTMGSQDSILEDNRKSGISGIFGGIGRKRNDSNTIDKVKSSSGSKRDKSSRSTIWESPTGTFAEPLKPIKVGASAELSAPAGSSLNESDDRNSAQGKRSERSESAYSSISFAKESATMRPKSTPPDVWSSRGRAHTVTIVNTPSIQEPVLNDHYSVHDDEYDIKSEESFSADKNSRQRREDEKRLSYGSSKSNSDPDKSKVLQAVSQHNASTDQSDSASVNRLPTLTSSESTLSLNIEDKRLLDQLPNFNNDPEIDIDATEQQWTDIVPKSVTKDLEKKEIKRQQIINELMSTEKHHVRDLKIIEKLFYERLSDGLITEEEVHQMFPNLIEILNLHRELNTAFMKLKEQDGYVVKAIGDTLLSRFDGEGGNIFKTECASYCGNQSAVLSFIKEKSKKDQNFKQFLQVASKHPICRKFHLKDFIPLEFLRLTKYPLLLENIAKNTKKKQESEIGKVKKACDRCREILAFVNQTVKEAEDKQKIREIQMNIDRDPLNKIRNQSGVVKMYKDINLTDRSVIHQGTLSWKIGLMEKRKAIPLHCILFDEVLVLLQKQDEKYVLKCQGAQADKATGGSHAPFIRMDGKVIVRNVATDKKAFFVMPTSTSDMGPQMYEFAATSSSEMKQWMALITEVSNKNKDSISSESHRRPAFSGASTDNEPAGNLVGHADENHSQCMPVISSADEYSEIVAPPPDPVVSDDLLLKIKVKNQEINHALSVKFKLLAQLSGLAESDLETMLDMSVADTEPDAGILIKHSILCVDKLQGLLNESAMPESTFVKSRNQSQVDVTSLNQLSIEDARNICEVDPGPTSPLAKSAIPVVEPTVRSSTTASASLPPDGAVLQVAECDSVFTPDTEVAPIEKTGESTNPDSALLISAASGTKPDEQHIPETEVQNISRFSPSAEHNNSVLTQSRDQSDNSDEPCGDDRSASFVEQIGDMPPINGEEAEQSLAAVELNDILPTVSEADNLQARGFPLAGNANDSSSGDDVSSHSKSRPVSGIELCAQAGDVPVSKLMDIVMSLQAQLTQLMHATEEDEQERQRLRQENSKLREQLNAQQNSVSINSLPSYDEAMQVSKHPPLTSSASAEVASLGNDFAALRMTFSHSNGVIDSSEERPITPPPTALRHVTRRSTGF